MWFLTDKNGKTIELSENKITTVGRSNADILLTEDSSISRSHAKLEVKKQIAKSKSSIGSTQLIIADSKSKYGTYILKNNKEYRLEETSYSVSPKDQIRFGLQHHIFTVSYKSEKKYIVLTSGLTEKDKKDLEKILASIEGELCNQWQNDCTHLTTCSLGLTEKISCALASGIPIVNLTYWKDVLKAQEANEDIPDVNKYIPSFDNLLRGFGKTALLPDHRRKQIFNGLTFYFFDECQFQIYSTMIKLSGGTSSMCDKSLKKSDCARKDIVFIQPLSDSQSPKLSLSQFQTVNELLKKHQLRSIPASEIPLAILYCSLDQHCNPRFKYTKLLQSKDKEKLNKITTAKILAPETQDWDEIPKSSKNIVIPETVPETQNLLSQKPNEKVSTNKTVSPTPSSDCKYEKSISLEEKIEENPKKRKKIDKIVPKTQKTEESPDEIKLKKRKLDIVEKANISKKQNDTNAAKESFWDVLLGDSQEPENTATSFEKQNCFDSDSDENNQETEHNFNKNQRKKSLILQKNEKTEEKSSKPNLRDEEVTNEKEDSITIEEFQIKDEPEINNSYDDDYENSRREVDTKNDHDDSDNENEYSGQWIHACKRHEDVENNMDKSFGYKVKYVSMTDIQKGYKSSSKKKVFKKNKSEPIKRLTREDFYEWAPHTRN
ncbi:nibrin-like [Chelonus insularis]|uniref:nibrin-like n=1 Tax=Chelonus insularis TaxID=460826 RepID=UPI00158A955E|nr:nibrin-like [Chelonus insularis]